MATTVKAKREIFSGIEEISVGVGHSDEITLVQ
jgi:hypothetical protein